MATPTKKGSKNSKAKPHRAVVKTTLAKRGQTIAELRRELEARNRDLVALYDVTAAASQSLEIKPVLDEVVKKITDIFAFDSVSLYLFDPQREYLNPVASFGAHEEAPLPRVFRRGSLTGRVAETGEPILFENLQTDPRYQELSQTKDAQQRDYCFFAIFPIKSKQRFLGTINCLGKQPRQLIAEEIRLIRSMCDQIGVAVENINLFEEVRNKTGELESSNSELREALEQQTATSEILRVIASSPTDIQPVLDVVAENAAQLCDAIDGVILRPEGDSLRVLAKYGAVPTARFLPFSRGFTAGRAIIDRQTIHVHDILEEIETEYPDAAVPARLTGTRTVLNVPLLREGVAIGCIGVRRTEVRPFTDKQIALLKTFADQAVIAIENVRLFKELQERNAELREALEHQTATSEVLGIISRSPTDVQPVLDAIVESAAKVCGIDDVVLRLREGNVMAARAHFGPIVIARLEHSIDEPYYRRMREHGTLSDLRAAQNDFPPLGSAGGFRTFLGAALRQHGELIGTLNARRMEVRPFTPPQIKLLETFADQAVIAIENVRLFKELQVRNRDLTEALEQQTATSEILRVIASSPTDLQPVLDVVAESAARLCEAADAHIFKIEGDVLRSAALFGSLPVIEEVPIHRGVPAGRAVLERQPIHVHDLAAEVQTEFPEAEAVQKRFGHRTTLAMPLLREGFPIGVILIRRMEVKPFTDKQIALLKTFADQAVIAIENVRLFKELQKRNAELREALEHQTATAEVLGIISRSPTDVQPVLDAIVESAAKVCGIHDVSLRLRDGEMMVARAHFGPIRIRQIEMSVDDPRFRRMREHGTLHVPDARAQNDFPMMGTRVGWSRTWLAVPLRQ